MRFPMHHIGLSMFRWLTSFPHSYICSPAPLQSACQQEGAHPFLAFTHLARCAAAILARPSALSCLRRGLAVAAFELIGRPRSAGVL
jgi:hypothetical protein